MTDASRIAGFACNPLDRRADLRTNPAPLRTGEALSVLFCGDKVVSRPTPTGLDPLFTLAEAGELDSLTDLFLGLDEDRAIFGGYTRQDGDTLKARGLAVVDLRSLALQSALSPELLSVLAQARALLAWHATHRFCARCGTATQPAEAGYRRDCPNCGTRHFPRTDPVVIMLAVHGGRCLLGRQPVFPPGMQSCLAGFVEPGETIEDAVRREILEEAGIRTGRIGYFASQPWPMPFSQLMIGCFAEALDDRIVPDSTELEEASWYSREECAALLSRLPGTGPSGPAPFAIAHLLMRAFADGQDNF